MENFVDLMTFIESIVSLIDKTKQEVPKQEPKNEYRSENINELIEAFARAKLEFKPLSFNRINNYFLTEFIDLEEIHYATSKALSKNNLAVIHNIENSNDNLTTLHTTLFHFSGQWIKSKTRLSLSDITINTYRSLINEHKKVAEMAILDISANKDRHDDDGVKVMLQRNELVAKPQSKKIDDQLRTITKDEVKMLKELLQDYPRTAQNLLDRLKIGSFNEIPADVFDNYYEMSKKIIEAENEKKLKEPFHQF